MDLTDIPLDNLTEDELQTLEVLLLARRAQIEQEIETLKALLEFGPPTPRPRTRRTSSVRHVCRTRTVNKVDAPVRDRLD
jgi:hypothetical protein